MVKVLWHICLAWVILLNSLVYSVICVNYQMNKTFISEYFCENREVPLSTCQGKCYLNKQLDKASDSEIPLIEFRADFNIFLFVFPLRFKGHWGFDTNGTDFLPYSDAPYEIIPSRIKKPPKMDFSYPAQPYSV